MRHQEQVRCTSSRFINYERAYTIYFIRKGTISDELTIFARSLYQAVAHSVNLMIYAFRNLGVLEVVIVPTKASKSGLSVFRRKRGEDGIIKRLTEVKSNYPSIAEILANWDGYKSINHFIG